jgi:hypothetical protein
MTHDEILDRLREQFGADSFTTSEFRDNRRVIVPAERLYDVMEFLKTACGFDMLAERPPSIISATPTPRPLRRHLQPDKPDNGIGCG